MTVETDNTDTLPPWVLERAEAGRTGERPSVVRERARASRAPEELPTPPKAAHKAAKKTKKPTRAPSAGEWEVQVKTGQQGRTKWGWLLSVNGMAPDKHQIRADFGPGHYRVVEAGGYSEEFIIAKVPTVLTAEVVDTPPEPEGPSLEQVVQNAVAAAVKQAMIGAVQTMRPLMESMKGNPEKSNEAINELRSDLGQLAQLVRAVAERPVAPPQQAGPPWQMAIIEKVMTAGLSNMGIAEEEEEEEPDSTEKLISIGTTLLGAVMQNRGAAVPPSPAHPQQAAMPNPQAQPPQQQTPQPGQPLTLPGMTPEIEAELRAYAKKIGYDYDAAIMEANERGASAQALLEQCRALMGPLE